MADDVNVAAELARLRGEMATGFAKVEGQLSLLVERTNGTRADVEALEVRVSALEARRVPWPLVAAVSGAVSALGAAVTLLAQ